MKFRGLIGVWILACHMQAQQLMPRSINVCKNDTTLLVVSDKDTPLQLESEAYVWTWTTPKGIVRNAKALKVYEPGWFRLQICNLENKPVFKDSVYAKGFTKRLPADTLVCDGTVFKFPPTEGSLTVWNNQHAMNVSDIRMEGLYMYRIQYGYCKQEGRLLVNFKKSDKPEIRTIEFCRDDSVKKIGLLPLPETTYRWKHGRDHLETSVSKSGQYVLMTQKKGFCPQSHVFNVEIKECPCQITVSNTLYPKSKSYFYIQPTCPIQYFQLTITDAFGNMVFQTRNKQEYWNGTYKGSWCPEGIYDYELITSDRGGKKTRHGKIRLVY